MDSLRAENNGRWPGVIVGLVQVLQYLSGQPEPIHYGSWLTDQSEYKAQELAGYMKSDSALVHVILTFYYPDDPRKNPAKMFIYRTLLDMGSRVSREGVNCQVLSR
ncbi:MAG: hypothetical protein EBZ67_00630 [Chitinophagia bacterium]|nr:hypothetical protein [Chitinophagia bacterium]